jgi:uncharacterized protein
MVNLPKHPLRINVGFLLKAPIGYSRDIHFDFEELKLDEELYTGFVGTVRLNRTPQGILAMCDFSTETTVACIRCLKEYQQPLHTEFSELYAFDDRSTTDSELVLNEDGNIDLEPLVREYLLLEVPISALCRPDCKGLCPICGEDLNRTACEHAVRLMD